MVAEKIQGNLKLKNLKILFMWKTLLKFFQTFLNQSQMMEL
jgi:hypothetical protein